MKRFLCLIFALAVILSTLTVSAETVTDGLKDGKLSTRKTVKTLTVQSDTPIDYIYIIFWDEFVPYVVKGTDDFEPFSIPHLHHLATLTQMEGDRKTLTIEFSKEATVCDVYTYSGELPDTVQKWESGPEKTDLLLFTTHADDEQLFFAGILPYYAKEKGYRVRVAYFVNHNNNIARKHELLNGLWEVGITLYPTIGVYPDAYSESYDGALKNIKSAGYTEDDVLKSQVDLIRLYKPQVVVGHDLKGEYGHGQHMLNAGTLVKAVELAAKKEPYPEDNLTVWDTPKLYLHLYDQNKVKLGFLDTPLESLGGLTPFQVTQKGFKHHETQQYTWFRKWLNGANGEIKKASQINTYSPADYGLYRTTVGEDVEKTGFFENIIPYDEQERIEKEKEEQRKAEELKAKEEAKKAEENKKNSNKTTVILLISACALIILVTVVFNIIIRKRYR